MTRLKTILATTSLALTFAAGIALAQDGLIYPRRGDAELAAARQSLQEAMTHLERTRNPSSVTVTRARAYIALATTELQTEP